MKLARVILILCCLALLPCVFISAGLTARDSTAIRVGLGMPEPPAKGSWYFAVSGDSRDCGDVIMPKIAASVAAERKHLPVKFYWHLGDFRAIYRIDCDIIKRTNPQARCAQDNATNDLKPNDEYLKAAWPDFIEHQVGPFEKAGIPIYLGIGNHDTINRPRDQFRLTFKKWLTQTALRAQRRRDARKKILSPDDSHDGDTYFHFVLNGVDFINLDNSNIYNNDPPPAKPDPGFSAEQLRWLSAILKADEANKSITSVVVGMHAALPGSVSRSHAMQRQCESFCNGNRVYELLEHAKAKGKQVLVLASHSHYREPNVYDTPEHAGHVLPGWIIGTAGAEQYRLEMKYGYLLVEVKRDGTLVPTFQEVTRTDQPLVSGPGAAEITDYCFARNKKVPPVEKYVTAKDCPCNGN